MILATTMMPQPTEITQFIFGRPLRYQVDLNEPAGVSLNYIAQGDAAVLWVSPFRGFAVSRYHRFRGIRRSGEGNPASLNFRAVLSNRLAGASNSGGRRWLAINYQTARLRARISDDEVSERKRCSG